MCIFFYLDMTNPTHKIGFQSPYKVNNHKTSFNTLSWYSKVTTVLLKMIELKKRRYKQTQFHKGATCPGVERDLCLLFIIFSTSFKSPTVQCQKGQHCKQFKEKEGDCIVSTCLFSNQPKCPSNCFPFQVYLACSLLI